MVTVEQYATLRTEQVVDTAGLYSETDGTFKLYEKAFEQGNTDEEEFGYRRTEEIDEATYDSIAGNTLEDLDLEFDVNDPQMTGKTFSYLDGDEAADLDEQLQEEYRALIHDAHIQEVKGGEDDNGLVLYEHLLDPDGQDRYRKTSLISGHAYGGGCSHAAFRTGTEDDRPPAGSWLHDFLNDLRDAGETVEEYHDRWDEAMEPWRNVADRYSANEPTPKQLMANDMERAASAMRSGAWNMLSGSDTPQQGNA